MTTTWTDIPLLPGYIKIPDTVEELLDAGNPGEPVVFTVVERRKWRKDLVLGHGRGTRRGSVVRGSAPIVQEGRAEWVVLIGDGWTGEGPFLDGPVYVYPQDTIKITWNIDFPVGT
jgi:hypothetical protein